MKTENAKYTKWMRLASSLTAVTILLFSFMGSAQARILFEDDAYFDVESEGIILDSNDNAGTDTIELQFGNDGTDATMSYDPTTQDITFAAPGGDFDFSDDNITTTGAGLFAGTSEFHIREVADESTAACTTVDEIVLDTTENRLYVCTGTGAPGTWTAADSASLQDFDSVYDTSQSGGNLTMEIDNGTLNFNITTADSLAIQDGGTNIGEFTGAGAVLFDPTSGQNFDATTLGEGDIVLNSADDMDFDADDYTLDTSASATITTGTTYDVNATGAVTIDSDAAGTFTGAGVNIGSDGVGNEVDITSAGTGTSAIDINVTGAGGDLDIDVNDAITIDSATLDILTTGVFSIDGTGASNMSVTSGNLTLSTITSGDVNVTSVGDIVFTDQYDTLNFAQVSAGMGNDLLNAGGEIYSSTGSIGSTIGGGETSTSIIHAINAVGTYATGIGAGATDDIDDVYNNGAAGLYFADVDTADTGYNITSTDGDGFSVQDTGTNFADFAVDASGNAIIDFDPYDFTVDATNLFSIQGVADSDITTTTGDISLAAGDDIIFDDAQLTGTVQMSDTATDWAATFATDGIIDNINSFTSTAVGEGASNVGINDAGTYFTATDVEGALQELGADVSIEVEDLTFYPEYPDTAVWKDGSNNRGTLRSEYDSAQDTNHYNWTSRRTAMQDVNVQFMFVLPPDYSAIGTNGLQFEYRTGTNTTASNKVDLYMYERTGAGTTVACGSDLTNVNGTGAGGAFATGQITKATIDGSACSLTAGDVILIEVQLFDDSGAADFADVGYVTLDYTR